MSISVAEPSPPGKSNAQTPAEDVTVLPPVHIQSLEVMQEGARREIAKFLVIAYLALLSFSMIIPVTLLWIPHVGANGFSITNARDLMLAMSGSLSGLVGILGFVMGYYFKALDKPANTTVSFKTPKKPKSAKTSK